MEKFVKELLTDKVLEEVGSLYGVKNSDLYFVGGFENYIYGFKTDKEHIVRITHSSHRSVEEIKSELDFIFYLAKCKSKVSMPLESINNKLVEVIECKDGSYFIICAFEKAIGTPPNRDNLTPEFFFSYGKTVGEFHRLTKEYNISHGIKRRYNWNQDLLIVNAKKYLPKEDEVVLKRLNKVIEEINKIDKNINNFGLIHTDIHMGNFFVHNNELTVFDFDDLAYQYFISDIAIALYYFTFMKDEKDQLFFADKLMEPFMKGYLSINYLSKEDYLKIPLFLKLREIILYIVFHRTVDVGLNEFANKYINRYKNRIINNIPFLDIDFLKYY